MAAKKKDTYLRLSLDEMNQSEYFYTEYDVGGEGHYIVIKEKDLTVFLDAWAAEWRSRAREALEKDDEFEE